VIKVIYRGVMIYRHIAGVSSQVCMQSWAYCQYC